MTNESTRTGRPTPSPASSSTIAIVLAVIAAVVGFFIIKQIRDDNGSGRVATTATTAAGAASGTTLPGATLPSVTQPPSVPVATTTGTSVIVANGSSSTGVAGKLTKELQAQHFTLQTATNATTKSAATHVYYDPAVAAAKPVADTVAALMGVPAAEAMPSPVPIKGAKLPTGAGVVIILGSDKAGKALTDMGGTATTAAGSSAVPTT